jgi:hypothetical protein
MRQVCMRRRAHLNIMLSLPSYPPMPTATYTFRVFVSNLPATNGGTVPIYISSGYTKALTAYLDYMQSQSGQATSDTTWQT